MAQQRTTRTSYTESDLQLALFDIQSQRVQSQRRAATIYNVPQRTLSYRRAGRRPRRDCEPNLKRLNKLEEEAIVKRVLKESAREFTPIKAFIYVIANKLLYKRRSNSISKN